MKYRFHFIHTHEICSNNTNITQSLFKSWPLGRRPINLRGRLYIDIIFTFLWVESTNQQPFTRPKKIKQQIKFELLQRKFVQ